MPYEAINRSVIINAPVPLVWETLTNTNQMKRWLLDTGIDVTTTWKVNSPIVIKGNLHGIEFENRGAVVKFEPNNILCYSHLSSLSQLPDEPANHVYLEFELKKTGSQATLLFTASNFKTEIIKQHIDFYWRTTLGVIKHQAEQLHLSPVV